MSYHDILNIIIVHRNKILKVTVISTVFLFLILFLVYPVTYNSTVSVLPPEKDTQFGGLSGLMGGQDLSGLLTGSMSNASSQLYKEMLQSRTAAEYVVKKNNLIDYYDADNIYYAARDLTGDLNIEVTKEGIIKLNVDISSKLFPLFTDKLDTVKKFSAIISNSFIEALDKINREKLTSKAKRARIYIEVQLNKTRARLDSVENELMEFQQKNKTISLPEQLSAAIGAAAELKSEIVKTEIRIGLLKQNLREDNKELIALRQKLNELQEQYNKMEIGNQDYLLEFSEVPELGKELAELMREVKIQNEVYIMLQQQFYKEKIQENRDLPTIEILDEAVPPLRASSPRLIFSTVLGGIFVFLLMSFIVIVSEGKAFTINKNKSKKE